MKRFISISLFFLSFFKQKPNFTCYRRSFSSPSLVFFLHLLLYLSVSSFSDPAHRA